MRRFKAIAAMAENRVIGRKNQIPWHLPEDFKWFKRMTMGHVIAMGRKTFESIGRLLPNRETVVISRSKINLPGARVISALSELDNPFDTRDIYICGGGELYLEALPLCSDLYLTRVKRIVEGDVFFPPFEHLFKLHAVIQDAPEFRIEHFRRDSGGSMESTEVPKSK